MPILRSTAKFRVKIITHLYFTFQVEALCVLLANGKKSCDVEKIVAALHSSGSKLGIENEELVDGIPELQAVLA